MPSPSPPNSSYLFSSCAAHALPIPTPFPLSFPTPFPISFLFTCPLFSLFLSSSFLAQRTPEFSEWFAGSAARSLVPCQAAAVMWWDAAAERLVR